MVSGFQMPGTTVTARKCPGASGVLASSASCPARGDFIGRHLPKSFVGPWDSWLQTAIAHSRDSVGRKLAGILLHQPDLALRARPRSVRTGRLCRYPDAQRGPGGALLPPGDRRGAGSRAGRLFTLPQPRSIGFAKPNGWRWRRSNATNWIWTISADRSRRWAHRSRTICRRDRVRRAAATPGIVRCRKRWNLTGYRRSLASDLLRRGFPLHSLWWTDGSELDRPLPAGLRGPAASCNGFAALLAGNWQQWGWNEKAPAGVAHLPGRATRRRRGVNHEPETRFPKWSSAGRSHVGMVRAINEDACLVMPELGLWAVADGMGGHEAGDIASQMMIEGLQQIPPPCDWEDFLDSVRKGCKR
jgi:type VI secretion system protein ImpM